MFETIAEMEKGKTAKRTVVAFPVALAVQVSLACGLLAYSYLSIGVLQPPPMFLQTIPREIPIVLPIVRTTPAQEHNAQTAPVNRQSHELTQPNQVDNVIRLEGPAPLNNEDPSVPIDDDLANFIAGLGDPGHRGQSGGGLQADTGQGGNTILPLDHVRAPHLIRKVAPEYPAAAIAMRMTGRVVIKVVVNEAGRVVDAAIESSTNAMFNEAALRAVRQWEYTRPIDIKSQQAVSCYMQITVDFRLD